MWKADLQKGVSLCNICGGLCSYITSVLLPHRSPGFRCGAVVINCPSEHSAIVEEEILLGELEIFVSSTLETLEML